MSYSQEIFENMVGLIEAHQYEWAIWKASERRALEQAAQRIEPTNEPDDWTDYAKTRAECAAEIRAMVDWVK